LAQALKTSSTSVHLNGPVVRAGLIIGQTGQMPEASRFWGTCAWISKHSFNGFSYF